MSAMITDNALDAALNYIKNNAENLYICNNLPTNFTEASSTYKVGVKANPAFTGPANGDSGGRKLTVNAVTDGSITGSGTIYYIAITKNTPTSELLVVLPLVTPRLIDADTTFTLTAFDIEIPDPA
jgi:hypothetical protein